MFYIYLIHILQDIYFLRYMFYISKDIILLIMCSLRKKQFYFIKVNNAKNYYLCNKRTPNF